jgi:hypothetical protein
MAANQINLAPLLAVISVDNAQSASLQVLGGLFFSPATEALMR